MINTMNDRLTALTLLRAIEPDTTDLLEMIMDYCDGDEFLDADTAYALRELMGGEDQEFADTTQAHEILDEIAPDLALIFAIFADLCHLHSSDPAVCADYHLS